MTLKKLLLVGGIAALVYWLSSLVIDRVFLYRYLTTHLGVETDVFKTQMVEAIKPGPPVIGSLVASFFSGLLIAFVFLKTAVHHPVAGALRGAVIGLFFKSALDIILFANTYLYSPKFIMVDVSLFVAQSILAGIVVAMTISRLPQPVPVIDTNFSTDNQ